MRRERGRWHARWGGEMKDVSANPGHFTHSGATDGCGATGKGLPLLGGLVTFEDLRRGYVNHMAWPSLSSRRTEPSTPGRHSARTAAASPRYYGDPEEMRFRPDPHLDIRSLDLTADRPDARRGAQKYGIVVHDQTGSVVFYVQDPVTQSSNPGSPRSATNAPTTCWRCSPGHICKALRPRLARCG